MNMSVIVLADRHRTGNNSRLESPLELAVWWIREDDGDQEAVFFFILLRARLIQSWKFASLPI